VVPRDIGPSWLEEYDGRSACRGSTGERIVTVRLTLAEVATSRDIDLGVGDWLTVDQDRIDHFAEATDDHQWIHVDRVRAADGPFGATVAHGYLTMSLLPRLFGGLLEVVDRRMGINYGIDRLRLIAPVRSGSRIRLKATLRSADARGEGYVLRVGAEVQVEGGDRPALVGELLYLVL
jgi:acyl dehydratase